MTRFRFLFALFFLSAAAAFAQCNPHPTVPDGRDPCPSIADQLAKAGLAAIDFNNKVAALNDVIEQARRRYWAAYPNGPGLDAAEVEFQNALWTKDMFYMMFAVHQGMTGDMAKMANAIRVTGGDLSVKSIDQFPTNVDNGIRPYAMPLFAAWVNALRRSDGREKDGAWANPMLLGVAVQDKSNWRKAYEGARNWAEFLASGKDISKYMTPEMYIRNQMQADLCAVLGQAKPADLPNPSAAALGSLQSLRENVRREAGAGGREYRLARPQEPGGWTSPARQRGDWNLCRFAIPESLFVVSHRSDQKQSPGVCRRIGHGSQHLSQRWGHSDVQQSGDVGKGLPGLHATARSIWRSQCLERRRKVEGPPERRAGGDSGRSTGAVVALLVSGAAQRRQGGDPRRSDCAIPRRFLRSALGGGSLLECAAQWRVWTWIPTGFPRYATIYFKESSGEGIMGFSPNSEMLQSKYGNNFAGLVGKQVELLGEVNTWRQGGGVRILDLKQIQLLDSASADFRESRPDWLTGTAPAAATNLVDTPEYLGWKRFPRGTKLVLETRLLTERTPGEDLYIRSTISRITMQLDSVDDKRAVVTASSTIWSRDGKVTQSPLDQLTYPAKKTAEPPRGPEWVVTNGEETLVINGKKIPTKWESVASAKDPMAFTKTWRSDEVPGSLVLQHGQQHADMGGKPFRTISETIYAPIDGVMPVLGDATPPASGAPAPPRAAPAPVPAPPPVSDLQRHYNEVSQRATSARLGLAQYQRLHGASTSLPADVRTAITARLLRATCGGVESA